jgi:hypothetical protein
VVKTIGIIRDKKECRSGEVNFIMFVNVG